MRQHGWANARNQQAPHSFWEADGQCVLTETPQQATTLDGHALAVSGDRSMLYPCGQDAKLVWQLRSLLESPRRITLVW